MTQELRNVYQGTNKRLNEHFQDAFNKKNVSVLNSHKIFTVKKIIIILSLNYSPIFKKMLLT